MINKALSLAETFNLSYLFLFLFDNIISYFIYI